MTDPIAALLCSLHDHLGQGHARPAQRGEQGSQMTIASTNRPASSARFQWRRTSPRRELRIWRTSRCAARRGSRPAFVLGRHDGRVRPPDRVFARSCDGLWLDRRVYADREAGLLDGTVATCAVTGAASKHVVGLATAAECPLLGQMEDPPGSTAVSQRLTSAWSCRAGLSASPDRTICESCLTGAWLERSSQLREREFCWRS